MNNQCECKFDGFSIERCDYCLKFEKDKTTPTISAGEVMEELLTSRFYQRMKMSETHTKSIKHTLRKKLESSDQKRHEFKHHNMVAKFVTKKIMETDYVGLNEYLDDRGFLLPVVKVNHKDIKKDALLLDAFSPYQLETRYKLHIAFNKAGKEIKEFPINEHFDELPMDDLFTSLTKWDREFKQFATEYDRAKVNMLNCPILEKEKKIKHTYGSLSKVALDPHYNVTQIFEELGSDFLIRYGVPDSERVQDLVYKGFLSQSEIDHYKQVVDLRTDFVVLSLEAEERMLSMLHHKKMYAAQSKLIG